MDVSPHSALKHRTMGVYFKFCRDVMISQKRTLYYVDLFAGDGICKCKESPKPEWDPPYFSNLREANKRNLDLKCIFNDLNYSAELSNRLKEYSDKVIDVYNRDANEIYKTILTQIPPDKWSIFVLDPYNHSDLNFSTISSISQHDAFDSVSRCIRKPELIITFMTYTIQQYLKTMGREDVSEITKKQFLKSIDNSLGTKSWRKKILDKEDYEREDKIHNILLEIFINQLGKLGYDTVYFHIKQTAWNSVLYFLIFATSIPRAYSIISEKFEPYIRQVQTEKWVKENFSFYKRAKARETGNKLLDDFVTK
jgi:three-Cys-motif partner protein